MLQTLRDKTSGWIAFIILGAVSIPFAFFGIEQYFQLRTPTYVAKVGEREISQDEFRERFEQYRQNARRQLGEAYDAEYFGSAVVKRQVLEQMVNEELLTQAAETAGTGASDERVRREIAAIPAFQVDGKFDPEQYRLLLRSQAPPLTPAEFEQRIRRDVSARELPGQVSSTAAITDVALDRYLALREQTRDFAYAILPPPPPPAEAPTPEAVAAWYEANKSEFMTEEQVTLRYVEIDASTIALPAEADEATLRQRYEDQRSRFVVEEQRLASHILVKVEPDADAEAQKAAQEKAAALAARAREAGADFAALAREASDDVGSKAAGGDLGWIEKGITQPAFETALFALQPATVSDPVKTDEGYHVIQLREVQAGRAKAFEEVRDELAEQYRTGERERLFAERSGTLIDQIYKHPTELGPAAEALGAEVQRIGPFGRLGGDGIAAFPGVVREAFSDRVLADGGVSDPITIAPQRVVAIQLEEHKPRAQRPLDEVRADVVARIQAEATRKAAAEKARALGDRFEQGGDLAVLAAEAGATVADASGVGRQAFNHDGSVVEQAFKLVRPAAGVPVKRMVELTGDRFALVELRAVVDGDPAKLDAALRDAARTQLEQAVAAAESRALVDALRAAVEVRIVEERM
jgi:peptidyl-prolyl cis-trans isomerase D